MLGSAKIAKFPFLCWPSSSPPSVLKSNWLIKEGDCPPCVLKINIHQYQFWCFNKLFLKSVVMTLERTLKKFLKDFVIFRVPLCWTFLKLMPCGYKTRHPVIDIDLSGSWVEKGIREDNFWIIFSFYNRSTFLLMYRVAPILRYWPIGNLSNRISILKRFVFHLWTKFHTVTNNGNSPFRKYHISGRGEQCIISFQNHFLCSLLWFCQVF